MPANATSFENNTTHIQSTKFAPVFFFNKYTKAKNPSTQPIVGINEIIETRKTIIKISFIFALTNAN